MNKATDKALVIQSLKSLGQQRFKAKLRLRAIKRNRDDLKSEAAKTRAFISGLERKMQWELDKHKDLLKS